MNVEDLIGSYAAKKKEYGKQAYRHISKLLQEAKERHKQDFGGTDHEQSSRKDNKLIRCKPFIHPTEVYGALG